MKRKIKNEICYWFLRAKKNNFTLIPFGVVKLLNNYPDKI